MKHRPLKLRDQDIIQPLRALAEQAFSRAAGAPLITGNEVLLLKDSTENYPAWFSAIHEAQEWIHFENYIFSDDDSGRKFRDALIVKAKSGVRVRILYDWLGCISTPGRFWQPLIEAGGEVREFNPPRLESPFGWLSRDHRKMIGVDGRVGFVTGLCVSSKWAGDPARGVEPWRDTGLEIRGPAVFDIEQAFSQSWDVCGDPLPQDELPVAGKAQAAGEIALRIVATAPNTAELLRLDQFIAAVARKTLWLSDAYFMGVATYVQALRAAAADGVDVRLLVPGGSDIPALRPISTAGFKPLLEAGVRVFEWNGPMMHAKSAVADTRWARVGSTNLNISSWIGNYELDVSVEDAGFAKKMEDMYLNDLENATELLLSSRNRVSLAQTEKARKKYRRGSVSRAALGAVRISKSVGAAMTSHRILGLAEGKIVAGAGALLLIVAIVSILFPKVMAYPFGIFLIWISLALLFRAWTLWKIKSPEN